MPHEDRRPTPFKELMRIWRATFGRLWNDDGEEAAWERFKAERMPAILATHPLTPGGEKDALRAWLKEPWDWIVDGVCQQVLDEEGDFGCFYELGPDSSVERVSYPKEPEGPPRGGHRDN
jgi:hypothetical protein